MTDNHSEADGIVLGALADRRMLAQICFSLALVALADGLFYRHPVGWTLGAYGALSGLGVILLGASPFRSLPSVLLGVCFFGLCLRAVIDPEPMAVLLAAPAGIALTLTLREGWTWSLARWLLRGRQFVFGLLKSYVLAAIFALALPVAPVYALLRVKGLRAWLIPLALGLLFLGLFALANPVIALAVSAVWKAFLRLCAYAPSLASFLRLLLWVSVGALLWTLLRHRTREDGSPAAQPAPCFPAGLDLLLSPEVIRNALIVFNALFAVQTALDLWYLWGGGTLPQGLTYAGYAHRGAYPLVATALLAAAFVLATFREGSPSSELRTARRLVYVWLLQNIFLVASAGWRLWLYVSVFSLSRLRVAAGVWMYLVACGLIWIAIRIFSKRSNAWLVKVNVSTAAFVLMCYGCSAPNMFIADFNVRHCKEAGCPTAQPIDLAYLTGLGHDALPALVRLERQVRDKPSLAKSVRFGIDQLSDRLDARLRDWRGVTIKRRYVRDYVAREYLGTQEAR
jgi:hypothetical protein